MTGLQEYARHSPYSHPGPYAALLDALPTDLGELMAVARNVVVHYRSTEVPVDGARLAEVDHRWLDRLLATDQRRFGCPLGEPRPESARVVGCCRDLTLLTVAALRHRGVPARSRAGFADYLAPDFHHDHVVVEYWTGTRWAFADPQLDPEVGWPFDPRDVGTGPFATSARVWTAYRRGEIDVTNYGVAPDLPLRGARYVRDYVLLQLAHRQRDELLLWDAWGLMAADAHTDAELIDDVAALLLAADGGDTAAERELAAWYHADPRLNPNGRVYCHSPTGSVTVVDLSTRDAG
jgi:hypothetical protein